MENLLKIIGVLVLSTCTAVGAGALAFILMKIPNLVIVLSSMAGFLLPVTWYIRRLWNE